MNHKRFRALIAWAMLTVLIVVWLATLPPRGECDAKCQSDQAYALIIIMSMGGG